MRNPNTESLGPHTQRRDILKQDKNCSIQAYSATMQIYKVGTQRGKERKRKEGRRGTMPSENSILKRSAASINSCPSISKKMVLDKTRQREQTLKAQRHPFWRNRQILLPHFLVSSPLCGPPLPPQLPPAAGRQGSVRLLLKLHLSTWIHNSLHEPLHSPCHWPHPERALGSSCGRKLSLSWCLSCLAPCPALLGQLMGCEN